MQAIDYEAKRQVKQRSDFSNRNAKRRFSFSLAKKFSILLIQRARLATNFIINSQNKYQNQ